MFAQAAIVNTVNSSYDGHLWDQYYVSVLGEKSLL